MQCDFMHVWFMAAIRSSQLLAKMSTAWRLCKLPRCRALAQLRTLRGHRRPQCVSRPMQGQRSLTAALAASSAMRHLHISAAQSAHSPASASAAGRVAKQPCRTDRQPQHRLRSASAAQPESASTSAATPSVVRLAVYSKDGCHLCDNLKEKLEAVLSRAQFQESALTGATMEVRDITSREDWFQKYQYEIPVLTVVDEEGREHEVPRASPRVTADRLEKHIVANLGIS